MRRVGDAERAGSCLTTSVWQDRLGVGREWRHEGRHVLGRQLRRLDGRQIGRTSAKEFIAVTGTASVGAIALALMFGATGQASPGGTAAPRTSPTSGATSATATTAVTTPAVTPSAEAEVSTTVTEVVAIPFAKQTVDDGLLDQGKTVLRTAGRAGSKSVTWLVRTRGGVEISRTLSGEQISELPVDEVTAIGTKAPAPPSAPKPAVTPKPTATPTSKPAPSPTATKPASTGTCDPNYSGACVPIASDVDCAGGSGNGPAYVRGPVQVVGTDIYGLDADHDGVGCE
jgi:hypothetical protein